MEEKRDVPIEFRLDALEEELFRFHEDVLEAENVFGYREGITRNNCFRNTKRVRDDDDDDDATTRTTTKT